MTHRAESVLVAFTTAVTGLTTTSTRVVRGRAIPVETAPALSVNMGSEEPASPLNMAYQDELLEVVVTAFVKGTHGGTDTTLNTIAAEVYAAIMASRQLGLAYVHDTRWQGRGAPQREQADQTVSSQELRFIVHYRHSSSSAES